jgi:CubicO group peptidase (beta-lactamase class C family)
MSSIATFFRKTTCFLSLVVLASNGYTQLNSQLQSLFEEHELMGMSVVKVCQQDIETYHFGLKDYTRDLAVDDSTMYRIASISKTVSAMGLMKLYEQGLFQLDDDVSEFLGFELRNPNWPEVPITFRMILSHTSSIQDGSGYSDFLTASFSFDATPPSLEYLLTDQGSFYTANMFRQEEPGTYFAYSNINYGIVGTLIEGLSNQRFDVFMKSNILNPLGIAGSYNVGDIENIDNVAVLYRNQGGWTPQVDNFQGLDPIPLLLDNYTIGTNGLLFGPQGGLRISPFDLSRILLVMKDGSYNGIEVILPSTIDLMQTPQWIYDGDNGDNYFGLFRSWGLGVHCTTDTPGGDVIFEGAEFKGHPGEAYGLISDMYWFTDPGLDAGFIFMTNGAFNGFEFGEQSAFYTIEEEVFQVVCSNNFQGCFLNTEDIIIDDSFEVYPNPSNGKFYISGDFLEGQNLIATIRNSIGVEVAGKVSMSRTLEFADLPAGIYTLTLSNFSGFSRSCLIEIL